MGSIVPFIDLNLLPDSPEVPEPPPLIFPKIEAKSEPFDEQFSILPNFSSNSNQNPDPDPIQQLFPESNSEGNDVYSEFFRVSELFRSAFTKKGQKLENPSRDLDPDSLSIVPRYEDDNNNNNVVSTAIVQRQKSDVRSSEMVRVSELGIEDQRYFRDLVRKTRMVFETLRISFLQEEERLRFEGLARRRGDLRAASLMKLKGLWLNREKRIIGSIPGIYVGDIFFFRMELCILGLHGQVQAGIDYVPASRCESGEPVATSIVVSGGYEDDEDAGDVIIYTGHGGQLNNSSKQSVHQKLDGGNLALERSQFYGIEIRVIRGIKNEASPTNKVYVYDGLYRVVDSWFDIGKSGFGVYKYKLVRIEDQPVMGSSIIRFSVELKANPLALRPSGYLSLDISRGKEKLPVFLFNDIDSDQGPLYFEYLAKTVYPPLAFEQMGNSAGCNCVTGCSDDCYCIQKNGGEIAYDQNRLLLRGKQLIFECGRHCSCPPTCRNRVSQYGLKHRLEVFRSRETGWGVRPLDLITAGSFICEYTGVVLTREQAMVLSMNGDGLVYPNRFPERWTEWGDFSQVFPDYVRSKYPSIPPLDFAMDVSRMRNVACYISHSICPNVLVQLVLYDHHNLMYPHLMLFAIENIPPFRELSIDYGVADDWTGKLAICN